jgi:putative intracellular protease/amidase
VSLGVAALLDLRNGAGEYFVKGRKLTAFSDSEQKVAGLTTVVPFSLESRLIEAGAVYTKEPDYKPYTVTDNNLICGQNPISAREVSRGMLTLAKNNRPVAAAGL